MAYETRDATPEAVAHPQPSLLTPSLDLVAEPRKLYQVDQAGSICFKSGRRVGDVRIPNYVYDLWPPILGTDGMAVYSLYCRLERSGTVAGLNLEQIARFLRIGTTTLVAVNAMLESYGFVSITRPQGINRLKHYRLEIEVLDPPDEVPSEISELHCPNGNYRPLVAWLVEKEPAKPEFLSRNSGDPTQEGHDCNPSGIALVPEAFENRAHESAPEPSAPPEPADAGQHGLPLGERLPLSRPSSKPAFTAKLGSPKPLGTAIKVKNRSLSMRARLQRTQDPVGPKPNGADRPVWQSHGSPATPAAPSQPPYPPGPPGARQKPGKRQLIEVTEQALTIIQVWADYYRADCKRTGTGFSEVDPAYIQQRWMYGFCCLLGRGESPKTVTAALDHALGSLCYPVDRPWSFFKKYDLIKTYRAAVWGWLDRKAYMKSPEAQQENEENAKYYDWLFSGEHDPKAPSQPMFPWEVEALNYRGPVGSHDEQTESENT